MTQHLVTLPAMPNLFATLAPIRETVVSGPVTMMSIKDGACSVRLEDGEYLVRYYDPNNCLPMSISMPLLASQTILVDGVSLTVSLYEDA